MSHAKISFTLLGFTCLMVALRMMNLVPTSVVLVVVGAELLVGVAFITYALWPLWALRSPAPTESPQSALSPCERLVPLLSERLPRPAAVVAASEVRNIVALWSAAARWGRRRHRRGATLDDVQSVHASIWRGPCGFLIPALLVDAAVVVLIMVNIPPAPWRIILDIMGIMGLVWLTSFMTSLSVFDHRISRGAVKLRFGSVKWVTITGEIIAVQRHHEMAPSAINHYKGGVFTSATTGSTNLRITFADGAAVTQNDNGDVGSPVREIRLAVDRPEQVVEHFIALNS